MTGWIVVPVVAASAAVLLLLGRWVARRGGARLLSNSAIDEQLLYQPLAVVVALVTILLARLAVPGDPDFLQFGDLDTPATGLRLLGVIAGETWWRVGLSFSVIATAVTAVVVWGQVIRGQRIRGISPRRLAVAFCWAVPISVVNAAVEETVFRLAPAEALAPELTPAVIAVLSGVLFGLPHWFGKPGGLIGMLMAGFLGWLMSLSLLQTRGVAWAWGMHTLQDIVILTILFAAASGRAAVPAGEAVPAPK